MKMMILSEFVVVLLHSSQSAIFRKGEKRACILNAIKYIKKNPEVGIILSC